MLSDLCRSQGIGVREVSPGEYALPIGALAGIPISDKSAGTAIGRFEDEMLVMCHMLSDQLDAFLRAMRGCGMPPIALKAVLTPTNVTWNSLTLHDELSREHDAMQRRGR